MQAKIPRLVIAATKSGSGKTTLVAGILAALRARGLKVQAYKVGPDYIDPGYHALASGRPAYNLDSWLLSPEALQENFFHTSADADMAIIEGVMGLYDGGKDGISSTAEIAKLLQAPVLLVLDVKSMGASAAAVALGFRAFDRDVNLAGVLLNRLGSSTHTAIIREAMQTISMKVYGAMLRDEKLAMPERHLGLTPTTENIAPLQAIADAVTQAVDLPALKALAHTAPPLSVKIHEKTSATSMQPLTKVRIGVAHDEAFSFYYPDSLRVLQDYGAELVFFSQLQTTILPRVDGLIFGGGFPEMFAAKLAANTSLRHAIHAGAQQGMPIYAECGGYMYLMAGIRDFAGNAHPMAGVFPSWARMKSKLQTVGYVEAKLLQPTILGAQGTILHGHEFHFSLEEEDFTPFTRPLQCKRVRNGKTYAAGQCVQQAIGSYLHLHFAGCQQVAQAFIQACAAYQRKKA